MQGTVQTCRSPLWVEAADGDRGGSSDFADFAWASTVLDGIAEFLFPVSFRSPAVCYRDEFEKRTFWLSVTVSQWKSIHEAWNIKFIH